MALGVYAVDGTSNFAVWDAPVMFYTDGTCTPTTITGEGGAGTETDPWTKVIICAADPANPDSSEIAVYESITQARDTDKVAALKDPSSYVFTDHTTEDWAAPITALSAAGEYATKNGEKMLGADIKDGSFVLIKETDGYRYRVYVAKFADKPYDVGEFDLVNYKDRPYQ